METLRRRTFIVGLLLSISLILHAQIESHYTYRRYTPQDGLPQMQTERVWQDTRGYIYVGTLSGFVRYDGREFTPFLKGHRLNIVGFAEVWDEEDGEGEPGEVRALGFFRQWTVGYDDIEAHPLDSQSHWLLNNLNAGSLPNGYVLLEDSLEQHRRLCRMTKRGFEPFLTDEILDEMTPDRKIFLDVARDEVIVPLERGVYRMKYKGGKATMLSDRSDVYTLLRTDSALLAFASDGIYAVGKEGLRHLVQADWSAASYGLTVRKFHSGGLVVADEHAVYLYEEGRVHQVVSGINLIRDVLVDRWNRLWVATYQGLYCFFNRGFMNHQLTDEGDIVRAVAVDADGRLVMGSLNGKVMVSDAANNVMVLDDNPEQFYAPCAVRIGEKVYMAGNGDLVCIEKEKDGGRTTFRWLGLPRDRYQFVGEAWGRLISGSRNGIFVYDPMTATFDTLTTEILHPWCAVHDAAGRLWIGSSSGLFSIDKARLVKKTEYRKQKLIISAMDADEQGNIFFASSDSLFLLRKGVVEELNSQMPRLNSHEIRALHVSPRGYLVVAVVDGLFVCRIDEDGQLRGAQFFNHQNGFTMTEPLKAMMAETSDGTVWLPGVEQMTSFRPAELLALDVEDTYIYPPLQWWQHWWVWLLALLLLLALVWILASWWEKRRNYHRMLRLQGEKLQREALIAAIRQKAIEDATNELGKDIAKMAEKKESERITFRTASGTMMVDVMDIVYFKGEGNYSRIVTFYDSDVVLTGLGALEKMLGADVFVRADRSTLVNIHHISNLLPKQRRCVFRSPTGKEVETTLLAPAFKRLQEFLAIIR